VSAASPWALLRLSAFRNAYFRRGFVVWGALRLYLASPFGGGLADPNVAVESVLIIAVAIAVLLDARRRREHLFLGNLGISAVAIALCGLPVAFLAECLLP
jgi:hypothetical protein